ncbi:MAG: hypothetical protein ACKVWV_04130 [Planctomycetota bacterium]
MSLEDAHRLPVVALGAEYLVMGFLMRRNILAYKAPPNNDGYDIICIHPDPRQATRQLRIQVKSRYATDSNRRVPIKGRTLDAFDYLVMVRQNIGYYYRKRPCRDGLQAPVFYTLPADVVRQAHPRLGKGWEIFSTRGIDLEAYEDAAGFEQIARDLDIPYPERVSKARTGGGSRKRRRT